MEPKMTVSEAAAFLNLSTQAIHKRIKSKNLSIIRKQNRFFFGHETSRPLFNIPFNQKKKVYVFQNIKGGVGKTEISFCFAIRANLYGARVLCIDLDLQGNLTKGCFKVNAKDKPIMIDVIKDGMDIKKTIITMLPGLDLIPSNLDNGILDNSLMLGKFPLHTVYKERFNLLRENYDLIIVDCPPALTASVTAAALAADEIIAPVTPDEHSISGLNLLLNEMKDIENKYGTTIPIKILFNKYDSRNNLSHEKLDFLSSTEGYKTQLYSRYIKIAQDFPNAIDSGQSIFDVFKHTAAKEDIDLLTKEILGLNNYHQQQVIEGADKCLDLTIPA
jgi:chromosome partitioning protein